MAREVVILSAARTPVGRYLGTLQDVPAVKLGAIVIAEAVKRAGIEGTDVEVLIMAFSPVCRREFPLGRSATCAARA